MSAPQFINTNIVATANFSSLTSQLSAVTSQLLQLQQTVIGTNKVFQNQVSVMNRAFAENMRSTGQFATHFVTLNSDVENFGRNLDSGKLKLSRYFKTWQDHAKTSGGLIRQLAQQQVTLQNAVIQPLGKNAQGLMQYNVHVAQGLDTIANKTALAAMQAKILNKVMQDGANQLINWGKNTQWAGRQLTVGLTLPLAMFGQAASKAFLEADKELVRLTKVYGGLAATSASDLKKIRNEVAATAKELAAQYGASYTATIGLAADIAATGKQGQDLLDSTVQTTRLAILGEVEHAEAMKATLAIQSTFKQSTDELTQSIDFLNAVENQTSTTLNDLVIAIPKAGPVIQAMGGSVKDLSLLLVAMKEGGINASEGANALKSALASLINPTKVAKAMFADFGIDLSDIVTKNAGNLTGTIMALQSALDKLNPLQKQQAIEQLFGKFQFSRLNALFANLGKQGSQTLQVLDLMNASAGDLANLSSRELAQITESASGKFKRALESVKADMAQIGNSFLSIGTTILNIIDGIVKFFGKLPDPLKKALTFLGGITAVAGPLIMLTGVLANFFGYIVKGLFHFKALFKGGEGWKYLTPEILAAEKAGSLIEKTFYSDAKAAATLQTSLHGLSAAYKDLEGKILAANIAAQPTISTIAGSPILQGSTRVADPSHPLIGQPYSRSMAHLNPVSKMTEVERLSQTIFSTVPNPAPVNRKVGANPQMYMTGDMPLIPGLTSVNGASTGIIASEAAKWHSMTAALAMQSEQELTLLKKEVSATGGITTSLSTSYQRLLPEMTKLTTHAAQEGAKIVAALEAGAITVAQAQAEIVALNARIEAMMVQTSSQIAAIESRSINLTSVPLLSQPIIDPATGKSNMKELFRPGRTASTIDAIADALGVRTSGGGYSIATTKPKFLPIVKRNTGGEIFTAEGGAFVPGVGNTDTVPAMLTPGEFVVNKKQTQKDPQGLRDYNAGRAVIVPVQKFLTGGEVLEGAHFSGNVKLTGEQIKNAPRLFDALPPHMQASVLQFPGQTFLIQDSQILTLPRILNKKLRLASRANLSKEQALGHIRGVPAATMFSGWNLDERLKERLKAELLTQISLSTPADPAAGYRDPDMERIFKTTKERLLNDTSLDYEDIRKFAFSFREAEQKTKVVLTTLKDVEASAKIFAASKKLEKLRTELGIDIPKPDEVTRFSTSKNADVTKSVGWFDANAKRIAERYFAKYPDKKDISIPNSQGKRNIWVNSGNGVATVHEGGATTAKLREAVVLLIDELTGRVRVGKLNPTFAPRDPRAAAMTRRWIAGRATGGPVNKNTPYIVGEKGPELFIPRHDGGIIPNNKLNSGGPVAGVRYYGTGSGDGPVTADTFGSVAQAKKALRSGNPAVRAAAQTWLLAQSAKGPQVAVGGTPGVFQGEQSPGTRGSYTRGRGFTDYQIRGSQVSGIHAMPTYRPIYDNNPFRGWQPGVGTMAAASSLKLASSDAYARAGARLTVLQLAALNKLLEVQTSAKNALQTSGIVIKELRGATTAKLSDAYARSTYRPTSWRELSPFNPTGYNARRVPGQPFGASLGNHPFAVSMAASAGGMFAASKIKNPAIAGIVSTMAGVLPFMLPQMLMQKKGAKAALLNDEARLLAERNGTTIAQERQALVAKQQAEKAAAQAARTSALASKTGMGARVAAGAEKGMLALMLAQGAKVSGIFARIGPMIFRIASILKSLTIPGLIITALIMIGKYFWDAHKAAQAAIQAQSDSFKLNAKQAKQAGIAYVDFKKKVEDVREQQRLMMEAGRIALQSSKNSSIGGLVFSYQELKKATKDAKKNMPDVVKMFDDLNFDQVADAAANLKVQFVSQGMSAEKAAIKIYGIVAASNKAGQAADAISTKAFMAIQDKSTAATASVQGLAKAIKSDLDAKVIVSSFEAMVSAVDASTKALIGTKDETGKVITEAEALEATFKQIHSTQQGNVQLGEDGLKALQDQNPLLIGILNKNDTIAGTYAKMRLVLQGIGGDLSAVNSKTAQAMLLVKEGIDSAALAMATGTDEQGIQVQSGNLTALVTLVNHYKKASLAAALASTSAAKKAADGNKAEIKSIQEKIAAINDEADARKRALEQQTSTEDAKIQLKKLQLDYQDAIATGNTKDAAQIQLSIRQLVLQTNKTQALAAIEEKRNADLKIQNALLAKAQEKANAAQLKATNQSTAAQNAANTLSAIQSIQSTIASLISQRATVDPTTEAGKLVIAGLDSQFKKQLAELTKYGTLGKNAANALSPGGIYNAKLPSTDYSSSLAKLSADALKTASTKFVGGVDKFALYVDKLSGTSGLAYSAPTETIPLKFGGVKIGDAVYMRFSSGDGKKNIQVATEKNFTDDAYNAYIKKGWKFLEYATEKNNSPEHVYHQILGRNVPKAATGGQILHYEPGGTVRGPGTATSDSIPAYLSNGEYVIRASAVDHYGTELFDKLNTQRFHKGGKAHKHPKLTPLSDLGETTKSQIKYLEDWTTLLNTYYGAKYKDLLSLPEGQNIVSKLSYSKILDGSIKRSDPASWAQDSEHINAFWDSSNRRITMGLANSLNPMLNPNPLYIPGTLDDLHATKSTTSKNQSPINFLEGIAKNVKNNPYSRMEVLNTLFHEFGHALQSSIRSQQTYSQMLMGINDPKGINNIETSADLMSGGIFKEMYQNGYIPQVTDSILQNIFSSKILTGTATQLPAFEKNGWHPTNENFRFATWAKGFQVGDTAALDDSLVTKTQKLTSGETEFKPIKFADIANLEAAKAAITAAMVPSGFHKGGPVGHRHGRNLPGSLFRWNPYPKDMPDYWSDGSPSGSPYTQRWGALRYGPAKGKDIWGGTEIPGLPFSGKIPNRSDYWHQILEQPNKSSGPGMGLDKSTPPLVGSGASAWSGGLLGGGGGQMFHKGGLAEAGHKHGIAGLWDKFKNQANKSLMGSVAADVLSQAGYLGQTALSSVAKGIVPKPSKEQDKSFQEFTGIPQVYRALAGKTDEGPLGQISPKAGAVADWAGLLTFFTPYRSSGRAATHAAGSAAASAALPTVPLSPMEMFRGQFPTLDPSMLPKGTVSTATKIKPWELQTYQKILARHYLAKKPDPRTLTQHEVAVLAAQKVPGFENLRVHTDHTADSIADSLHLNKTFNYTAPLTRSESSLEELLTKSLFHGGNLPTTGGKVDLKNRTGLNSWYGGQMFAAEDYRQALAYLLKSPDNSVYSITSALKKEDVIDLRHNANTLASQQPFVFAKLLRDIESGKIALQDHQSKDFVIQSLIGQEGGRYPHASATGALRDKIFQLYFKDISPWLAENGIKAIAHRNGTRVAIPEIGTSVSDNPTRVQDFNQLGTDALAYTTVENSIGAIKKHTITSQQVKDIVARIEATKSDLKSSKIEAEIMALLRQSAEIPRKAMGGLMVPQAKDWSNKTKFATGGMVNKAKYNLPSPSVSINKSMMPNSNNSAVHHYDVGGLVVNSQPGQDEKTIATMVVNMLDQKNMMREAMYGRQRSMSGSN
jgi:TP901 family phage tail tape measure protein